MTAPEPVEVEAAELAVAVAGMRSLVRTGAIPAITDDLRLILAELDRRARRIAELEGMVCTCHQGQAMEAQLDRLTARIAELEAELRDERDALRAELTRTVADCGICRLGARTVHVDDDCPRHGEGDW